MRPDLGRKGRGQKRYTFNYDARRWPIDEPADAVGLDHRLVHRRRTGQGRERPQGAPTQKPEALLHRLILASSKPGDLILDPSSARAPPAPRPSAWAAGSRLERDEG